MNVYKKGMLEDQTVSSCGDQPLSSKLVSINFATTSLSSGSSG